MKFIKISWLSGRCSSSKLLLPTVVIIYVCMYVQFLRRADFQFLLVSFVYPFVRFFAVFIFGFSCFGGKEKIWLEIQRIFLVEGLYVEIIERWCKGPLYNVNTVPVFFLVLGPGHVRTARIAVLVWKPKPNKKLWKSIFLIAEGQKSILSVVTCNHPICFAQTLPPRIYISTQRTNFPKL